MPTLCRLLSLSSPSLSRFHLCNSYMVSDDVMILPPFSRPHPLVWCCVFLYLGGVSASAFSARCISVFSLGGVSASAFPSLLYLRFCLVCGYLAAPTPDYQLLATVKSHTHPYFIAHRGRSRLHRFTQRGQLCPGKPSILDCSWVVFQPFYSVVGGFWRVVSERYQKV